MGTISEDEEEAGEEDVDFKADNDGHPLIFMVRLWCSACFPNVTYWAHKEPMTSLYKFVKYRCI